MDEVSSDPGPRGSQGVAQCYSSSINIGPLTIQSQLFLDREKLGCKGFIHLHTQKSVLVYVLDISKTVFRSRESLSQPCKAHSICMPAKLASKLASYFGW